jgi:hypothetical protein
MTFPVFASGDVLNASDMNAVGKWLVASGSVGTSTTRIIDNVFSSTYENYHIVFSNMAQAGTTNSIQWRTGGATNSTSNYAHGRSFIDTASMAWQAGSSGTTSFALADTTATVSYSFEILLLQPFATALTHAWFRQTSNNVTPASWVGFHIFKATTSFDGMILTTGGNMSSGTYRIYGLRN